ncbi:MAG: ABC-F family ATP-binding cassette domain-containing protein [Anaerolineae bacterium]|nr:ABC-F family ATP-binding cassette domain-containing protein [Anaerolineae bacterium]MCI0610355.1 ABC-F family ATP-binding cassette domain-containing protein [Anaerolineae bacterium]
MSLINVSSLSKSFGAEDLFSGVTFSVAKGARLALVGPNGIGKTTLLRILIGQEEPSSGMVTRAKNLRMGYLSQEADFELTGVLWDVCLEPFADLIRMQGEVERLEGEMSDPIKREHSEEYLRQALVKYGALQHEFERRGGYIYQVRIKQVLTGLGFDESDFHMSLDHLSGGQRTRAHLARLLLSNPDLLLLDEPTNHLDIKAVEWLEGYLTQWEGAAVIVSHDRYFLDHACNALLEMAISGSEYYRGNYTTYLNEREIRWNHRFEIFESEKEKLLKELDYIKKNISGQNTLQAKGRLKRLTRAVQAIEQVGMDAAVNSNWAQLDVETTTSSFSVDEAERRVRSLRPPQRVAPDLHLHLRSTSRSGDLVIRTKDLQVGYPPENGLAEKLLFRAPNIELRRTDCAALIGPNGAGKSTFLKTILGSLVPLAGEVILGASLHVGYFAQAHEGLDPEKTVLDEILEASPGMLPYQGRDYLGKYLFSGDDAFKKVSILSGGERGRLALAKLALEDTNLLLLDEPTNHLDIPSQEVLQAVLDAYKGTILLVTHDRYLVDALATQIWEIDPDESHLTVFNGTYSQMKEESVALRLSKGRKEEERRAAQTVAVPNLRVNEAKRAKNVSAKEERRKIAQLQELENTIAELETQLANLGAQLESPFVKPSEAAKLGTEYERVQREMDEKLDEWERMQA